MSSVTISCLFLILGGSAALAQSLNPEVCRAQQHVCVGEGETCNADPGETCPNSVTMCRECNALVNDELGNEVELRCHHGICVRQLASAGDTCDDQKHLFCTSGLQCSLGVCTGPGSTFTSYKEFGRECSSPDECISGLCTGGVCSLTETSAGSGVYTCSSDMMCPWGDHGMHCAEVVDSTGRVRFCKDNLPLNDRLNRVCTYDGECGHLYSCNFLNPWETDEAFQQRVCGSEFFMSEGEPCSYSGDCGRNLICDQTSDTCYRANTVFEGYGCMSSDECGAFMECRCPEFDGGRKRCMLDNTVNNHNFYLDSKNKNTEIMKCVESNKCQDTSISLNPNAPMTCGRPCLPPTEYSSACSAPSPSYREPAYMGLSVNAASSLSPRDVNTWFAVLSLLLAVMVFV